MSQPAAAPVVDKEAIQARAQTAIFSYISEQFGRSVEPLPHQRWHVGGLEVGIHDKSDRSGTKFWVSMYEPRVATTHVQVMVKRDGTLSVQAKRVPMNEVGILPNTPPQTVEPAPVFARIRALGPLGAPVV